MVNSNWLKREQKHYKPIGLVGLGLQIIITQLYAANPEVKPVVNLVQSFVSTSGPLMIVL